MVEAQGTEVRALPAGPTTGRELTLVQAASLYLAGRGFDFRAPYHTLAGGPGARFPIPDGDSSTLPKGTNTPSGGTGRDATNVAAGSSTLPRGTNMESEPGWAWARLLSEASASWMRFDFSALRQKKISVLGILAVQRAFNPQKGVRFSQGGPDYSIAQRESVAQEAKVDGSSPSRVTIVGVYVRRSAARDQPPGWRTHAIHRTVCTERTV